MDQDVEAILNASDSEGDENLNVHGVSLEDILREDDGGEEYLDDGESGGIGDLHDDMPRLDSDLPDLDLSRWTTAGGDSSPPMAYRSPTDTGRGELSPGGGFQGLGGEGDQAGAVGTGSNPAGNIAGLSDVLSGDGYDPVLGGGPPRTAFLRREELSEDSRLLQQILKENDEDVAASSADRSKMLLSGAGGGSRSSFSVSGGSGLDLYAGDGFLGGVGDGDAGFDALQTLDVDKIIQSIENETEIEKQEQSLGAPWRTRLRSRGGAGMGAVGVAEPGKGTAGEVLEWGDGRHTRDLQQFHGGRGSFGTRGGAGDAGGLAEGLVSLGNGGETIPPTASLKAEGNLESGVSRRRHASPGRRVGALAVAAAPGEVRGGAGGGDGGLMSPLAKAEAAELRLLRGGNREMISPLQVKRRMRVPIPGSSSGQGSSTSGFPSGVGGGGVGVVRMENLDAASRQLARNAAYGKHGPGVCTAAGAHPKFIAVGTSRGLILLFDHFQEIRHVLGSAAGSGPDGVPNDDPVTSLDMCVGCDCLVAGHGSGRVLLWDFLRGVVLRAVADVHSSAVVSVRCFAPGGGGGFGVGGVGGVGGALGAVAGGGAEPAAITADMEGVVNKLCFRRVMWSKWVVDTECLLDGAAGPIPALCVLPNWMETPSSGATSSGSGGMGIKVGGGGISSPGFHDIGLMAMSSWKNTFVVGIYPDVKVIHKWSRPLLPGAAEHLPCPCLSWGPPQPSAARPKAPAMALLARGWGNSIQIMAATRVDAGGGDGSGGSVPGAGRSGAGTGAMWPRLEVVKELSASAAVVAVEWLQEQVLAYLDAEMELCVLDTRAGAELEHASLVSLGVALSPLLPPPPSSQPSTAVVSRGDPREETPDGGGRPEGEAGEGSHSSPVRQASPSLPPRGTYHNAFRACQGRLYLLGSQELRAVRVQGWSQRVDSLVQAGEWLEALAVALDHYEQKILPAEIAAASAVLESKIDIGSVGARAAAGAGAGTGVPEGVSGDGTPAGHANGNSWGSSTGLNESRRGAPGDGGYRTQQQFHLQQQHRLAPRSEAAEHINDLLAQYLRLAVNNAPAADLPSSSSHGENDGSRINLAHSHFQMLAGVCTEFCAVTSRLDMLFGPVFHAFRTRGHQGVFLDTLEPCVLAGRLTMLSPEILGAFVDRCQSAGDMITAERLVLRLDPRSIDLGSTLPLLRMHRLYTTLLAVRALRGDYVTSPEEVLQEVIAIADRDQSAVRRGPPSNKGGVALDWEMGAGTDLYPYPADPKFEELGNKILLYVKRCFKGQVLGSSVSLTEAETARARASLLALLVRPTLFTGEEGREAGVARRGGGNPGTGKNPRRSRWWHASFPYLSILLYVDPAATLDVLSIAMDSPEAVFREEESGGNYLPSPGGVAASGGDVVPVSMARDGSTSSMSDSSGRGLQYNGRASGGGVWGRRLGRGRARAIGWTPGGSGGGGARAGKVGRGGRGGERDGGRVMVGFGGETAEPSALFAGRGEGGSGVEFSDGAARCPSRRSIIEAVTRVLAPYLADCAEADLLGEDGGEENRAQGEAGSDLSEEDAVGMVSAAAFVHGARGSLASELVSQEAKAGGGDKAGEVFQPGIPPGSKSGAKVPSSRVRDRDGQEWWGAARPHLLDFVAKYLELSLVMVGPKLINAVLVSVADQNGDTVEEGSVAARQAQARLVTLLQRVPLSLVDRATLLPLAERNKYFRAAVILLKATVSLGEERGFRLEQFSRIVRCYLLEADDSFRSQVFGFIRQEVGVAVANVTLPSTAGEDEAADAGDVGFEEDKEVAAATQEELAQKRNVILSELPRLMELDKAEAVFTVGEAFRGNHKAALGALESTSTLQFEYLDALLRPGHMNPSAGSHGPSQDMDPSGASSGAKANAGVREGNRAWSGTSRPASTPALRSMSALASALDDGDRSLHVRLLIKFRPYEVYSFLSNSTGYSLDDTLALCQERGVADATAYLLERKGDVTGALSLALRTLSSRISSLRSALQSANLRDIAAEMAFVSPSSPSKRTAVEAWSTTPQASGWGHVPWNAGGGIAGGSAGSTLGGAGPRAGTAAWARWASKVALEGLQEGRETTRSLTVAIEMCQRASPPAGSSRAAASRSGAAASSPAPGGSTAGEARGRVPSASGASAAATEDVDDSDLDLSASLWFQTLDKILSAKGAASRAAGSVPEPGGSATGMAVPGGDVASSSGLGKVKRRRQVAGELPQTAALMQGVLDALLQRTLSSMAGYVPLPVIVKKVVSDHAGSSLGEFRHVILAMLDTYSYDTAIHRTATTLMFDSLRNAVREQHVLKGAGVRVCAVGAHKLPRPRLDRLTSRAAGVGSSTHGEPSRRETGSYVAKGATGGGERALPDPKTPPPALLEAVGSGVISVSRGGVAVVEHLGRAPLRDGTEVAGVSSIGAGGGDKVGEVDLSGAALVGGAGASSRGGVALSGQYESQASLWRLRVARRRRQARGDKMRSLVTWATEEHPAVLGVGGEEPASREARRGVAGGLFSRGKGTTREGALGERGAAAPSGAVGTSGGREREQGGLEQGGQALGWSVKLQARALAIPASFLPKRT